MSKLFTALVAFALLLVACAGAADTTTTSQPAISSDLSVLEWAFYEVPEMWVEFGEAYPDTKVEFSFGASDEDIYAKILAGSGEDIIHLYTPFLQFYVDEGLIQPIDTSKLANWDKVADGFKESCTIDGVVYCVPWDWGFNSILYRTDKIPEGIDSWDALFDPAYAGHVSMWDSGPAAVTISSYLMGVDERDLTEEQLAEIEQSWIDQKDVNLFYWTDEAELEAAITNEDIWVAYGWNGAYYRLLNAGVPVAYAEPSEGRGSWVGQYAISADAESYDTALAFLDGKLGEQTATHLLVDYAYGHPVPDYYGVVEDANLIEALSLDDPGVLERTNFTVPITQEQLASFVGMWAEVKAAG
ncbi:MAG TPA: extracellular solute-binding protein [Acidimicrobiia bacterium]|nr:extracellular solute-binding protein [Acidimicrobiia bacterium]